MCMKIQKLQNHNDCINVCVENTFMLQKSGGERGKDI